MKAPLLPLVIAAFCLSILFAACGGSSDEPTSKEVTESPTAGGEAPRITPLSELKSFRYSLVIDMALPALADQLGAGLAQLYSHIESSGAFVAPDKSESAMTIGKGGQERKTIIIGDRGWSGTAGKWVASPLGASGVSMFAPKDITDRLLDAGAFAGVDASTDNVDGRETRHYTLREADMNRLTSLFGKSLETVASSGETRLDLWLTDDGYPARLIVAATGKDPSGRDIRIDLTMNVTNLNDPAIDIKPPNL